MPIQIRCPKHNEKHKASLVLAHGFYEYPDRLLQLTGVLLGPINRSGVPASIQVRTPIVSGPQQWMCLFTAVQQGNYRLIMLDPADAGSARHVAFSVAKRKIHRYPTVSYPSNTFGTNDWAQGDADPDSTSVSGTMALQAGKGQPVPAGTIPVTNDLAIGDMDYMTNRYDWGLHFTLTQSGYYTFVATQHGGAHDGASSTPVTDINVS